MGGAGRGGGAGTAATLAQPAADEARLNDIVLAYLRKRGYRAAEAAFSQEASSARLGAGAMALARAVDLDASITHRIQFYNVADSRPERYAEAYGKLLAWVHQSLDLYKNELKRVLYPVFVHCLLELVQRDCGADARAFAERFKADHERLHAQELNALVGLSAPEHVKQCAAAQAFLSNKINVTLCQYSFDLLLKYLQRNEEMLLLSIVNENINVRITPGQPAPLEEEELEEPHVVVGSTQGEVDELNRGAGRWGVLSDSPAARVAKERERDARVAAAKSAAEATAMKRSHQAGQGVGASGGDMQKIAKEAGEAAAKRARSEAAPAGSLGLDIVESEVPLPSLQHSVEKDILDDIRQRVRLSAQALPSVCFYTMTHAAGRMNCTTCSADGRHVAGGFADSGIRLWDMGRLAKAPAGSGKAHPLPYTLLTGHAGPVYSLDFSPGHEFLYSSSADSTVRLWSLEMRSNLMAYVGHQHPVWDVACAPLGHYFATASHDRTARIWATDYAQPRRIMAGHLADVDCVRWHPNCNYIATGSSDKTVRLWDVQTGECVRVLTGHFSAVSALAMGPDGRSMASAGDDGTIILWDLGTAQRVATLKGHTGPVWSLSYSGEGSLLASGGADCSVRIWDAATGAASGTAVPAATAPGAPAALAKAEALVTLPTKETPVTSVLFSRRNLLLGIGAKLPT